MENINRLVGQNLRRFREKKKLSLDKVSELTGVSKAMLGQIERGESSPTIATVWKIANGLKVSFTSLLKKPQVDSYIISTNEFEPLVEEEGTFRVYPFFPFENDRRFEMYSVEIDPGTLHHAEPHLEGTYEFMTIFDGELEITVNDALYTIRTGDAIRFRADAPHAYHNVGNVVVRVSMVIHYAE